MMVDDDEGQTLDKITFYREKLIGNGKFCTFVFEGKFSNFTVAVKRVEKWGFVSVGQNSINEHIAKSSKLKHENIIKYFALEQDLDFWYLAMEKCDTTLSNYIRENQDIETTEKIDLVIQMSKAIAYLHAHHLIHRDVKPSNFLLKIRRKGWPIVKLTDLGFTKKIVGSSNQLNSKLDYAAMAWIAPELYDPPFRFTTACDVWSFGCVIYYSFTGGKHPFDSPGGRSLADRATNIIQRKINITALKNQSKDVINRESNQRLQSLILSTINHQSSLRPTAQEVTDELSKLNTTAPKLKKRVHEETSSKETKKSPKQIATLDSSRSSSGFQNLIFGLTNLFVSSVSLSYNYIMGSSQSLNTVGIVPEAIDAVQNIKKKSMKKKGSRHKTKRIKY